MSRHPREDLAYSKACDLAVDLPRLAPEVAWVDSVETALVGQHPIRRWEYAMALHVIDRWRFQEASRTPLPEAVPVREGFYMAPVQIADIGGGGSYFWQVLATLTPTPITVVDMAPVPTLEAGQGSYYQDTVQTYAAHAPHQQFDILTAISVIEHVKAGEVRPFLRACRMLLKPGGLLFLTTDYWDADGPDTAHFHWMRERIYTQEAIRRLLISARALGFRSFGIGDWRYAGPQVYDYSVASLALVTR